MWHSHPPLPSWLSIIRCGIDAPGATAVEREYVEVFVSSIFWPELVSVLDGVSIHDSDV